MQGNRSFDKKAVDSLNERLKASALWKLVDMGITSLAMGRSEMSLYIKGDYLNTMGSCHGGIIATFADTVMGVALYTLDAMGATIEMNINYMVPISEGQRLMGRGEVLRKGNTTAVIRADLFVEQTMVATARATFKIIQDNNSE